MNTDNKWENRFQPYELKPCPICNILFRKVQIVNGDRPEIEERFICMNKECKNYMNSY